MEWQHFALDVIVEAALLQTAKLMQVINGAPRSAASDNTYAIVVPDEGQVITRYLFVYSSDNLANPAVIASHLKAKCDAAAKGNPWESIPLQASAASTPAPAAPPARSDQQDRPDALASRTCKAADMFSPQAMAANAAMSRLAGQAQQHAPARDQTQQQAQQPILLDITSDVSYVDLTADSDSMDLTVSRNGDGDSSHAAASEEMRGDGGQEVGADAHGEGEAEEGEAGLMMEDSDADEAVYYSHSGGGGGDSSGDEGAGDMGAQAQQPSNSAVGAVPGNQLAMTSGATRTLIKELRALTKVCLALRAGPRLCSQPAHACVRGI